MNEVMLMVSFTLKIEFRKDKKYQKDKSKDGQPKKFKKESKQKIMIESGKNKRNYGDQLNKKL